MKAPILCALFLALAGGLISTVRADVFYVATDGSDAAGNGSFERPWATITAAVGRVPETGGLILVRDGVYTGRTRISRKFRDWLVLRAENPYRAKLQAAQEAPLQIYDSAFVEVSGFDVSRSTPDTSAPLAAQIARSENIVLRNNILHDSRNNDLLKVNESPRNILIIGNVFYNPQGEAGQHIDLNGCTNAVVRDNIFFNDYAGSGAEDRKNSSAYIVIKNSGNVAESRHFHITSNIFLNWEGGIGKNFLLLGEDGKPFHETQDVLIENNLMIGNSQNQMRSAFGAKGVKDVVFRNNTIVGDLPSSAFAMRLNREVSNLVNRNLRFFNNVWSDPTGTMRNFSDGRPDESDELEIRNNLYWNGGNDVPRGSVLSPSDDPEAMFQDPQLSPTEGLVLPRWNETAFLSGNTTIRQEFERLVALYGTPAPSSPVYGRSLPDETPWTDILDRVRYNRLDLGAVQVDAPAGPLRLLLISNELPGGLSSHLNQVILEYPAGPEGEVVELASTYPERASVPERIYIAPGAQAASFTIRTTRVDGLTSLWITATWNGITRPAELLLIPEGARGIDLSPDSLISGTSSTRNLVLIDGVAPDEGLVVSLTSSHPDLVTVPETVSIAAGRSYSEFFPVATKFTPEQTNVRIIATSGAGPASAILRVMPSPFRIALRSESLAAGSTLERNRIFIDRAAPSGGATVYLSSSLPDVLIVPETVVVPEGQNIAEFPLRTGPVNTRTVGRITAVLDNSRATVDCAVSPVVPSSILGSSSIGGGATTTFRVLLNSAAYEPVTIQLAAEGMEAALPEEVTIPAGENTGSFPVTPALVAAPTKLRLFATYLNRTVSLEVNVTPGRLYSFSVPATLWSGESTEALIVLTGRAPLGGLDLRLSTNAPDLLVLPESVQVPEGASNVRFRFHANLFVESRPNVTLTVSAADSSLERRLTLNAAELTLSFLQAATFTSGNNLTLDIRFKGRLPSGSTLQLKSSNPDLIAVPESVSVPDGASFVRATVKTKAVTTDTEVTVTASYPGGSHSRAITLKP